MKEESLLLLSDLQKLINQVVLIDYIIIILGSDSSYQNGTYFCSGRKAGKAHTEEAGKRASDAGCDN